MPIVIYCVTIFWDLPQSSKTSRTERPENGAVAVTDYLSLIRVYFEQMVSF